MTIRKRLLSGLLACFGFAIVCLGSVASAAEPQCICRTPDRSYLEGTCACLQRPGGKRELACCGRVLNNHSWRFTGEVCPIAMTEPPAPTNMSMVSADGFDVAPKPVFTPLGAFMPK